MIAHPKVATGTFSGVWQRALEFPVSDPVRLLATAVILRWVIDARNGCADPLPSEWAEIAEVPRAWLAAEQQISGWTSERGMMATA